MDSTHLKRANVKLYYVYLLTLITSLLHRLQSVLQPMETPTQYS